RKWVKKLIIISVVGMHYPPIDYEPLITAEFLTVFKQQTHWSEKKSSEMTKRDWKIFREDMKIYLRGGRVPIPCRTWAESPLPVELLKAINEVGYIRPTPIQMQAIPVAMEQRDLIGVAETGSGKTAAYMLPMLTYVNALPALDNITAEDGPYGIVMAPTRELALQIEEEGHKFSKFSRAKVASIVGGRGSELQAMTIRGCEIVIATPGKLNDALEKKYTVLNQCFYVVLDEADKMIDMGFEGYVNEVLDRIPASNLK
ncbi:DEAD-box ATP-dependent RNA helicase 21, partial [Perkinsus olseni]